MYRRRSVARLSSTEKADFVAAVLALKAAPSRIPAAQQALTAAGGTPNRYDDYVWMHNVLGGGGHRGPAFGPWHREFLRQFELDLRQVSGKPQLCVPYWDWTVDRTPTAAGWPFTTDFMGGFGSTGSHEVTDGSFSDPGTAAAPGPWRVWLDRVQVSQTGFINLGPRLKRSRGMSSPATLPVRDVPPGQGPDVLEGLGIAVYDVARWHDIPPPQVTLAEVTASFRKFLERFLHDGVHVWIGGQTPPPGPGVIPTDGGCMSFPPVAVNDPIFWLHHANVDRLWTIWQQRNPTLGYEPASGANAGHNRDDVMARFGDPSHFAFPVAPRPSDGLAWHTRGVWYESDLPEIRLATPSLAFGDVPEGLTTYRPARFEVRTAQRVRFRITAISGPPYSIPPTQGTVVVEHADAVDTAIADVHVAFRSAPPFGSPAAGTATIEAYIDDADGYFAATAGAEHRVGTWTVNMTATPVPRPRAAVSVVLDRSGSMSAGAGPAGTRADLLRSSLEVVADLMRAEDAIGLVAYDNGTVPPVGGPDGVITLAPITALGPAPGGAGRAAVAGAIASPDLQPRGLTAIGQGMIRGASVLDAERTSAATPYARFAMVVMTDGNENVPPNVTDPLVTTAIAGFSDHVYAIGLGREDGVSATTLGQIARYMLVTGDVTPAERRFRLTKYFVQVLADVTDTAIVTDPQGDLHLGVTHEVPFLLTEADVGAEVIVLSPAAPLLEVALIAPDGTVVTPATVSPNVAFQQGRESSLYRLGLPALPGVSGTHAGEWRAVLRVGRRGAVGLSAAARLGERSVKAVLGRTGTLPYDVVVQSWSNVTMTAEARPGAVSPGGSVALLATLAEYGIPVEARAGVVVEVLDPAGTTARVALTETAPGVFEGVMAARLRGVHTCRFRAEGVTLAGQRFQREAVRTVAATPPLPVDVPPGGRSGDDVERLCRLLACLLGKGGLGRLLERHDVDPAELRKCLRAYCGRERGPGEG